MTNSRVKSFMEIPNLYKNSCFTTESVESLYFDDASVQSSTNGTRHLSIKKYDSLSELSRDCCVNDENYNGLTSGQVDEFQAQVSEELKKVDGNKNEMDSDQNCRYKSLLSLIKTLRSFSVSLKSKSESETRKNNTIYRQLKRPTEYVYVKGISGLSNRIEKVQCNRCIMRNG